MVSITAHITTLFVILAIFPHVVHSFRGQPWNHIGRQLKPRDPLVIVPRLPGSIGGSQLPRDIIISTQAGKTTASVDDVSYAEDVKKTALWVAAAIGFAGVLGATKGADAAVEFCSGYILEQCLSVDNLFVFLVLFDYFDVQREKQDRVLTYGIWGAIVLRGIFVALGAATLQQFNQVLLLFSAVLAFSSYKILAAGGDDDEEEDMSENAIVKFSRKFLKTTDKFDGEKFFTVQDGISYATPLFLCLVCVELSDVVFAFDSVPAVFGVTQDPLIVYTSNIFAIAGLRSLFGVLSKAIAQLEFLEKGETHPFVTQPFVNPFLPTPTIDATPPPPFLSPFFSLMWILPS